MASPPDVRDARRHRRLLLPKLPRRRPRPTKTQMLWTPTTWKRAPPRTSRALHRPMLLPSLFWSSSASPRSPTARPTPQSSSAQQGSSSLYSTPFHFAKPVSSTTALFTAPFSPTEPGPVSATPLGAPVLDFVLSGVHVWALLDAPRGSTGGPSVKRLLFSGGEVGGVSPARIHLSHDIGTAPGRYFNFAPAGRVEHVRAFAHAG
jgi:hypothetical protein